MIQRTSGIASLHISGETPYGGTPHATTLCASRPHSRWILAQPYRVPTVQNRIRLRERSVSSNFPACSFKGTAETPCTHAVNEFAVRNEAIFVGITRDDELSDLLIVHWDLPALECVLQLVDGQSARPAPKPITATRISNWQSREHEHRLEGH